MKPDWEAIAGELLQFVHHKYSCVLAERCDGLPECTCGLKDLLNRYEEAKSK